MVLMKSKDEAFHLPLEKSGDDAKDEVIYSKYVMRKIKERIKPADDGRIISHREVKMLFAPQ